MEIIKNRVFAFMSYLAYIAFHGHQGQAINLATWNSKNATIFGFCQVRGWLSAALATAGGKALTAAFEANAINWVSLS